MKILHTSDWHLGQSFHDYDRLPEQVDMLRQIVEIVKDEQPDALLVSGDIFHTGNPSPAAVKLYNKALLAMHDACQTMHIVVTAGNHDSASRLVINNELWDYFNVTVVGNIAKNPDEYHTPDYCKHIIEITDKKGNKIGYVAAVPHCYESNFPTDDPTLQRTDRMTAYFQGLLDTIAVRNTDNLPVVLMAHLTINGCILDGHDNIGGMESRNVDVLGKGYDYVALGHIHTPYNINEKVRYCGTPIPVNFGERFEHSVSIVNIKHGEKPEINHRVIKNLIPLHDYPTEPKPLKEIIEMLRNEKRDQLCYLRILVKADESMSPLAATIIGELLKEKKARMCYVQVFYDNEKRPGSETKVTMTGGELKMKSPVEIAEMLFKLRGMQLTERQRCMITEATYEAEQIKNGDHEI